ncbi:restriction endonuclease [Geobacillus stearothermophilus]|nr:restriction endonuclease [Geobacillus stearothermophilus]
MSKAWVVRPYPHGKNRIKEFLSKKERQDKGNGIIAIGWPNIGDLSKKSTRKEIKKALQTHYTYSAQALGQAAGTIFRFKEEMAIGDYVLVPDGQVVYIGKVVSEYKYEGTVDSSQEGYPHQRWVEWVYDKRAIPRKMLTGRIFDSLKGRQTLFSTHFEDVEEIVKNKRHYFLQQNDIEIKEEYLKKLQEGGLFGVHSSSFEDAVCTLLSIYFPGLRRLSTTSSDLGDTDLYTELPGDVIIRIQVKYFYPKDGELKEWVVKQLADSMEVGEHGIIVTSGTISQGARKEAERYLAMEHKKIGFISGEEFVDMLFENIDQLPESALFYFGLAKKVAFF